jgi:hypothetical protein
MSLSHRQNAKQNHSIKATSQSFENVENFNYFGWTMTDKSTVHKETNSGMLFCGFVRNLSYRLLRKHMNIEIFLLFIPTK